MNLRRNALNAVSFLYGASLFLRARPGLRVLMYHAIGGRAEGDRVGLYSVSPELFEQHMRHLSAGHAGSVVELAVPLDDAPRVAVTFDDGYRDTLTVAAPLLSRLGLPFTVFACTAPIAETRPGFLNPSELRELAMVPGVTIGSHGRNHLRLTDCSNDALRSELRDSRAWLEDLLDMPVRTLSYPHGAVDARVRDAALEAGYQLGATSRFDVNRPITDPLLMARVDVWSGDTQRTLEQKLHGNWDWLRWRG